MKIVLIDDESNARSLLKRILDEHKTNYYEFFEADNLNKGVELIKKERPHLVFLDIDMPSEQGIEINRYFLPEEITFELVFATAYSEYALAAFELNASDYILKPLRPKKIIEIVEKVEELWGQRDLHQRLIELKQSLFSETIQKLGVPTQDGITFLRINELIRLEADGMYTRVFSINRPPILVSKPIKFFIPALDKHRNYFRTHRSHIVNLNFLADYVRKDGHYLVLENKDVIPLAKERKDAFLNQLNKFE